MFFSKARNKQLEVQRFLARLADQGAMDRVRKLEEHRDEHRSALSAGVWVIPIDGTAALIADALVALAVDVSSKGLAVITNRSISTLEVLIWFSGISEAKFLRATVLNCEEQGLGWIRIGMAVTEIVEKEQYPHLREMNRLVNS
ncbi:MAG: hypothetical protein WCJ35_06160 [Planctomycetota bacterium]